MLAYITTMKECVYM